MSTLIVYRNDGRVAATYAAPALIAAELLRALGVGFERHPTRGSLPADATTAQVHALYAQDIQRLREQGGYASADVVRLGPEHPERVALRSKFIDEHTHAEDEVRFFVEGSGAFYLRSDSGVHQVICEAGDLLRVPAGARHWFDMGPQPHFAAVRLFTDPAGWVGHFTGDDIARRYPRYNEAAGA